jgi:hypothetical protein
MRDNVDDTWKGVGRLGKLHFVFNTYNMAMQGYWFDLIALYDGCNKQFIVRSDLYNVSFSKSSREALHTLFAVFGNDNKLDMIKWEDLYQGLREYKKTTKELGLLQDFKIFYIHGGNIQERLNDLIEVVEDE